MSLNRLSLSSTLVPLLLLLVIPAACSDRKAMKRIRLVDPGRIASVESEQMETLRGEADVLVGVPPFVSTSAPPFLELDCRSKWYPFLVSAEHGNNPETEPAPAPSYTVEGESLLIEPGTGVVHLAEVKAGKPIFVECKGRFDPSNKCFAVFIQLSSLFDLPETYEPGVLKEQTDRFRISSYLLKPTKDGSMASCRLTMESETQALLFKVYSQGEEPHPLESVRMTYITPKIDFLTTRRRKGVTHPALATDPFIDWVVRPSFMMIPKTTVFFKEMEIPKGAEFSCSLSVLGTYAEPVKVSLKGTDGSGREHKIFHRVLMPRLKTWVDLKSDLKDLGGKRLKLALTCEWADAVQDNPPLVFCGSPTIRYLEPEAGEPGLNLIFVSLDTLRWDRLGCYGYPRPVTPNIDRLAEEQILFEKVYSHAPQTLSSHASIFTSLYPSVHGLQSEADHLPSGVQMLAEVLAREGLATASFNNGGLVSYEFGFHRGFDLYCQMDPLGNRYMDKQFCQARFEDGTFGSLDRVFSWIEGKKDERFYLFLHTFMIHKYLPPRELAEEFNVGCRSPLKPGVAARKMIDIDTFLAQGITRNDLAFFSNMYDASIRAADEMVGELVAHLDRLGLLDNTLLVLTSDHGEEFMDHGSIRHTKSVYEELIRVPLVMGIPGMEGKQRIKTRVTQVDLMPTFLELMGIECPGMAQGRSLVPLLRGQEERDRLVYAETFMPRRTARSCVILGDWKYVEGSTDESLMFPAPAPRELYLLTEDPKEQKSLVGNLSSEERNLKTVLDKIKEDSLRALESLNKGGKPDHTISPELMELLKQQGYL